MMDDDRPILSTQSLTTRSNLNFNILIFKKIIHPKNNSKKGLFSLIKKFSSTPDTNKIV